MKQSDALIKLDRYIITEIVPQFFTSFTVISAILVVSQLMRLSEVMVNFGFSVENFVLPFLFIVLPFVSFTIPMAFLFAVLLSFSRFSADGELTAMLALGYPLKRAARPVAFLAVVFFTLGGLSANYLEPWGRRELKNFYARKTQGELDDVIRFKMAPQVFLNNFLGFTLYAEAISEDRSHLENVMLAPGETSRDARFMILAPVASIIGSVAEQDLRMTFSYGSLHSFDEAGETTNVVRFKNLDLDVLRIFQDSLLQEPSSKNDYRSYPPGKLLAYIEELKAAKDESPEAMSNYAKARFLFHHRCAMPLACFAFGIFAMVFGFQDERHGKSKAFVNAITLIIVLYFFMIGMQWMGENAYVPAPIGAWSPHVVMGIVALAALYQRNRLPPSESLLRIR